jgi:membrane protein implicated in regulation of membrane protease activity
VEKKRGWGPYFLAERGIFFYGNTPPFCFLYKRGGGIYMIEFLIVLLLWELDASYGWWAVFVLLCIYKTYNYVMLRRAVKRLSLEMEEIERD